MTDPGPADQIRAAAQLLRTLATAASTDTDGTPTAHWTTAAFADSREPVLCGDYLTLDDGRRVPWPRLVRGGSPQRPAYMHVRHADYIAAVDPTVGLALAEWLDAEATRLELSIHLGRQEEYGRHALAVARQILGEEAER
ncbi:hypothetical protein [Streptomyces sp. SAJ15]|uniref:hypothetical protein n=1 Tax=Streptomyces sp. SAJ15 TaxID=2011095 RepID=UPI0011858402|nr:hypothetical protein [Streptomyces sp. SAJ15]TVL89802.1 hypothetical protein CD790_25740 [Streptomyces sp. SAJ15]